LDKERLLEWMPRPCPRPPGVAEARCTGADYRIWRYRLDDSSPLSVSFAAEPEPDPGFWSDIGAVHEIAAADDGHLVVWQKDTGELRSYALPSSGDPLGGDPVSSIGDGRLTTLLWRPPTASPELRNLLIVFQEGHSFDSYFGRYCKGSSSANDGPQDCTGPDCCEAMPAAVPGAPSCRVLDPETDTYRPQDRPACMRAKMNGGAMDSFASAPPDEAGPCGDARDFACSAGADGADTSAVSAYHELAGHGALADCFFQTYAFTGAAVEKGPGYPSPREQNLLYLLATYFTPSLYGA